MVSSVNVGRAKESIKIRSCLFRLASVLLVEPSPVASLPSFIKVGRGAVIHGIAFQKDSALGLLKLLG